MELKIQEADIYDGITKEFKRKGKVINCVICDDLIVQGSVKGCNFICNKCCRDFLNQVKEIVQQCNYNEYLSFVDFASMGKGYTQFRTTKNIVLEYYKIPVIKTLTVKLDTEFIYDFLFSKHKDLLLPHVIDIINDTIEAEILNKRIASSKLCMKYEIEGFIDIKLITKDKYTYEELCDLFEVRTYTKNPKEKQLDGWRRYFNFTIDEEDNIEILEVYEQHKPIKNKYKEI